MFMYSPTLAACPHHQPIRSYLSIAEFSAKVVRKIPQFDQSPQPNSFFFIEARTLLRKFHEEAPMSEQNFPKYRQRLNLLMKRLSKEPAGPVSGFAHAHAAAA